VSYNTVRYKIISPNGRVPTRSTEDSAYYDVFSSEDVIIPNLETVMVHTGIKIKPQQGYFIDIRSRSSMGKNGISISNSPGTLDSDYSGELMVLLYNHSGKDYQVCIGHKIAQINIMPVQDIRFVESDVISGVHKGWGSTGK
jgi:dUTP pyrophosphatase